MSDSFPCLVCGKRLPRVADDFEAQPYDGVMAESSGNYGSTIFDPLGSGEILCFNLCDECLTKAAEQKRVMVQRRWRPIDTDYMNHVGREFIERPFIPWHPRMGRDDDTVYVPIDELETVSARKNVELRFDLDTIRQYVTEEDAKHDA